MLTVRGVRVSSLNCRLRNGQVFFRGWLPRFRVHLRQSFAEVCFGHDGIAVVDRFCLVTHESHRHGTGNTCSFQSPNRRSSKIVRPMVDEFRLRTCIAPRCPNRDDTLAIPVKDPSAYPTRRPLHRVCVCALLSEKAGELGEHIEGKCSPLPILRLSRFKHDRTTIKVDVATGPKPT
jgi:hypothetical protein